MVSHTLAFGGHVYTEITSAGGAVITLAESGAGVVTTFAGSVYTVAASAAASAGNGIRVRTKVSRLMTSECQSFFLEMRQRGTSVRYISQHLYSQHLLQWPAVCYLVHGRHFRVRGRSFSGRQYP